MSSDVTPDTDPKPETGVPIDDLVQLVINVGFNTIPFFFDTNDSTGKGAMKEGPTFLRFPVQLSAKDAGILQQLLYNPVAFVAFEIQKGDGKPGYYRLVTTRN